MTTELLFSLSLFALVALATWYATRRFFSDHDQRLRARMRSGDIEIAHAHRTFRQRLEGGLEQIVHSAGALVLPRSREGQAKLRQRLGFGGLYSSSALTFFLGTRVLLVLGL